MVQCVCGCGRECISGVSRGHYQKTLPWPLPVRDGQSGCLLWQGSISPEGYARIGPLYVHRLVWETYNGPIPEGHQVDHVAARGCVHRHCIEPSHLEAVTQAENIRRQPNVKRQIEAEECPKGHPYSGDNLRLRMIDGRPKRGCRQCDRDCARREKD